MSEVKIPEGYKQTEIGVIPEDWRIATIEDIAIFRNGVAHEKFIDANGKYIAVNSKFISTEAKVIKRTKVLRNPAYKNEILMVMSDVPNGRAIAKCFLVPDDSVYSINQRICALNITKDNPKYIFYQLNRNPYYLAFDDGVKQTNLRRQDVLDCPLMIPPKQEQNAIATALSDIDDLIGSLEKLIAKKEAIKTATMQQLLTGKTRLPEFATHEDGSAKGFKQTELGRIPEDWEVFEFGSLINYIKGCPFKSADYQHTGVRIIRVSDTSFTDIKDNNPIYISDSKAKLYKPWKLQKGDLIISTVGSKPPMYDSLVGKAIKVTSKHDGSLLNQNALRVRAKSDTDGIQSLLLSHFRTERYIDFIEKIYRGNANQASITLQSLFEFKVPLPNSKKEQTAIATILSDMDTEIQALQQRLDKTKDIKQGMMQQLLTGKVRLAH
ncbi:restriction endonuclease subunit S [Psychrobacter okhotskensis]|uniref:restriction endonuclease subunit S n=1 Tax=Psychrobacter okhotskensis TaxID=212403 RepID=UPI0015636514|nr:restriction endonuclease subunit S [Psychrobacter okhotskensis]NRD70628.1 restriction endonuclease subunit S [Psychrobacter okhotskensis]